MNIYICNNVDKAAFDLSSNSSRIVLLSIEEFQSIFPDLFFTNVMDLKLQKELLTKFEQALEKVLINLISSHQSKYRTYKTICFKGELVHLNTRFEEDRNISFLFSLYNMTLNVKKYDYGAIWIYKQTNLMKEERLILDIIKNSKNEVVKIKYITQLILSKEKYYCFESLLSNIKSLQKKGFIDLEDNKVKLTLKSLRLHY